jgi:hypothetical protein
MEVVGFSYLSKTSRLLNFNDQFTNLRTFSINILQLSRPYVVRPSVDDLKTEMGNIISLKPGILYVAYRAICGLTMPTTIAMIRITIINQNKRPWRGRDVAL